MTQVLDCDGETLALGDIVLVAMAGYEPTTELEGEILKFRPEGVVVLVTTPVYNRRTGDPRKKRVTVPPAACTLWRRAG